MIEAGLGNDKIVQKGPWSANATVDLQRAEVSKKKGFSIHGRVTDGKGKPIVRIRVVATGGKKRVIANARTDDQGRYRLVADQMVTAVHAHWAGHLKDRRMDGRWTSDAKVDIQFGAAKPFVLKGTVRSSSGRALGGVQVVALDHQARTISLTRFDRKGRFEISAKQPVSRVQAIVKGKRTTVSGPWKSSAEVDITQSKY